MSQTSSLTTISGSSDDQQVTTTWPYNPMVMWFGAVGILFLITIILGVVNVYIWYAQKNAVTCCKTSTTGTKPKRRRRNLMNYMSKKNAKVSGIT